MANRSTGGDGLIDRRTVLQAGAALAAAGPALLRSVHAEAQPQRRTIIDSQVHAYEANTPQRPWFRVPNWPPHRVGRPSGYTPELADRAYRMSLLGLTDQELADFLGISCETLYSWKISYPEFRESITRGKIQADAHVAEALYRRACGRSEERRVG